MRRFRNFLIAVLMLGMTTGTLANPSYVHFFWNQHQPSYINPHTGKFEYYFTRLHAMSSYYFMAAALMDGRNDINTYEIQNNQWVDTGQPTGKGFPFVHITINLSGVLLEQLNHYVENLAPAFEGASDISEVRLDQYPGGDPRDPNWVDGTARFEMGIDLLCKPIENWSILDKRWVIDNTVYLKPESGYSEPWPAYEALREKRFSPGGGNPNHFTDEELGDMLMWWNLAVMHPYFKETNNYVLRGHDENGNEMVDYVTKIKDFGQFKTWGLPSEEWFGEQGETTDLLDMGGYSGGSGAMYMLNGVENFHFTNEDRLHLALMHYKILRFVVPVHRKLMNTKSPNGWQQLEVTTTPYSHPILPLVYDTDTWMEQMGYNANVDKVDFNYHGLGEAQPGPYSLNATEVFNDDTYNQVAKGAKIFYDNFGEYPHGMWPGEGSVGESVIYAFRRNNVKWIASGNETGDNSGFHDDNGRMYRIDEDSQHLDGDNSDALSICFRSERDLVGFDGGVYNFGWGADADAKAVNIMDNHLQVDWGHAKFWTHTADGENPWGWFHRLGATFLEGTHIPDGNGGTRESYGLYYRLNRANPGIDPALRWYGNQEIYTAHPTMYIGIRDGQYSGDGILGLDDQFELEPLSHGSWIFGNFDTWMGEENEVQGWIHLKETRQDFEDSGMINVRPDPYGERPDPREDRDAYFIWKAWEQIYSAESSDYFWWYGIDQCFGSDEIFDDLFRERLINAYVFARKAGFPVDYPTMQRRPIFDPQDNVNNHHFGGALSDEDYVFDCEPPAGHGSIIPIPPITQDPEISPATVKAGHATQAIIRVRAFEEGYETSQIATVYADLRELGGPREVLMHDSGNFGLHGDTDGGDDVYSAHVTIPDTVEPGTYLITIHAIDTDKPIGVSREAIESLDYVTIEVLPSDGDTILQLAGYMDTHLTTAGGQVSLAAVLNETAESGPGFVSVSYQGVSTGLSLRGSGPLKQSSFEVPAGVEPNTQVLFEMMGLFQNGQMTAPWPYLTVEP